MTSPQDPNNRGPWGVKQAQPNPYAPGSAPDQQQTNAPGAASTAPRAPAPGAPGPGNVAAVGNTPVDPRYAAQSRSNTLYDPTNPQSAIRNAMISAGMNPFSMNPVLRNLMAAAPGLANSFMLRATQGQFGGTTAADIAGQGGQGEIFKNFLTQALSGGGSGIGGALRQFGGGSSDTPNMLGSVADTLQENQHRNMNNPNALAGNVYADTLQSMLMNDPTNGAGMIASLYSPFMSPTMSRAYGAREEGLGYLAPRYQDWTNLEDNPFNYLIGRQPRAY